MRTFSNKLITLILNIFFFLISDYVIINIIKILYLSIIVISTPKISIDYSTRYDELEREAEEKKKSFEQLTTQERVMHLVRDGAFKGAAVGSKLSFASASTLVLSTGVTRGHGSMRRNMQFYLLVLAIIALAATGICFVVGVGISLCLTEALGDDCDSDDESTKTETPASVIDLAMKGDKVASKAPKSAINICEAGEAAGVSGHITDFEGQELGFISDYYDD